MTPDCLTTDLPLTITWAEVKDPPLSRILSLSSFILWVAEQDCPWSLDITQEPSSSCDERLQLLLHGARSQIEAQRLSLLTHEQALWLR
uniref:Uncharacterized protein n=1 Tax=Knipowitschia caucasica TaxID=637954 RepID=A0AAV2M4B0_KNICA